MTNHFANYWKIPFVLLFAFAFKATQLCGQIEVEPAITAPFSPDSLIKNVFLGDGIQITNIRFTGKPEAVGYFSNGMEDIGFEEGILLTTGESWQADRANTSAIAGSPNNSFANSAELERLTTEKLEDVLEYVITFRPSTDSIAFKYRFASEEYPEFGCDCFNDVFAFYIYGPGLDPNGENMAILPNSNLPVSVKTIHPFDPDADNGAGCMIDLPDCTPANENLYIDNSGSTTLEYDGFTRTLIARAKVTPCEEYTLKIAIADVKDDIVDSAVFLEAESFNSKKVNIEAIGVGLDGSIIEGCSSADLVFSIPEAKADDYTINFTKIGNATAGQDFVDFPSFVTIPAGQLSTSLSIETISDQVAEGLDSIGLAIEIAPCFPPKEIWIPIKDDQLSLPELGGDRTICLGDTVQLMGQAAIQSDTIISFIETPLSEIAEVQDNSSNPGNLNPSIFSNTVSGITPANLTEGLLHSICVNINHPRAGDLDIFLQAPSGRFIELSTDNGRLGDDYIQTCFTESATTSIMDGTAPFTGNFLPEGSWEKLYGEPINGTWNLIVRDDEGAGSGNITGTMLNWSINFNPDYQVTYAWEVSDSMSCQDCLDPLVFPSQSTQYTLSAIDNYGCTASDNITVNVRQPLVAPIPTCSDVSTSTITISWKAVAGAENYSVNINENGWEAANSGNLQHKITGLSEGESLAVQVRANSNGICASSEELITCETILCALPPFQLDSTNNVSCTAGVDGKIHVSATADAFFVLGTDTSELGQTAIFDQLPANTYKILVLAASKLCRDTLTATINEPDNLNVQITESRALSCFGSNDGAISTIATGGTAPYNYSWSSLTDPTLDFNEANTLSDLPPGEYRILVTDANNCADQKFLPIPEPQAMIIDSASLDETCFANGDGVASISVHPNFNNLNFLWSNGARTASVDNLSDGPYTVSVTNEAGCEETRQFDIQSAPEIILREETITPISCNGENDGIATVVATGGNGNFSYQWNDVLNQTTPTANQLIAQDYEVIATDEVGCSQRLTVTIPEITAITFDTLIRAVSCFGATNGSITLGIAGGTPGYNFKWNDTPEITTANRDNLAAGAYQLTVNDANNCTAILDFTIADKAPINLITNQTPASCNAADGIIVIGVIEGNSAYTFSWEDDPNRTTAIATNLAKGNYTVTVFDAEGCSATNTITLEEKEGINLVTSTTPVICAEESTGSATVVATGGSGNFIYLWDDPAAQESPTAQNLAAGDYMVLVIDNNGCEKTRSITVPDNTIPVAINFEKKDISCFGANDGQITTLVNSTSNSLTYQWSNGEAATSLTNIAANRYQLTITDENGCTHEEAITITEPTELFAETIFDPITCPGRNDGVLTILPMGGTPPYFFSEDGRRFTTKNEFFDLTPGNYEPAIKDANNCTVPIAPIKVEEALPLSISIDNLELKAAIPQEITPIINNGNGELTYTWSGNNLDDLSCIDCLSPTITPTNSQLYKLIVVDKNGCEATTRIRVLVEKNQQIFVPTGFTPNGDGANDRLTVHGIEGTEILSFKIFDRWGELVFVTDSFEANDLSAGWDGYYKGKPMNTNVFAWIVEARFSDGTLKLEKGHSTLIR